MALFLTGMINDGAHTANGPGETRFYQTGQEGRGGGDGERGAWGGGRAGSKAFCVGSTAKVSLSKAPSRSFCYEHSRNASEP